MLFEFHAVRLGQSLKTLALAALTTTCLTAPAFAQQTQIWTLVAGSATPDAGPVYSGLTPHPGARFGAATWTDSQGNLWLFGGATSDIHFRNDLWKYTMSTGKWSYVTGTQTVNDNGNYIIGANMRPAARAHAATAVDSAGRLWLFGGHGPAANWQGDRNDIWLFDTVQAKWEYRKGSGINDIAGDYPATPGTPGGTPGGRRASIGWIDTTNNVWVYGGQGFGSVPQSRGALADLWRFRPSWNDWTFTNGSNLINQYAVYPALPSPPTLHPGSRYDMVGWANGNDLWMFGGYYQGYLSDLWRYNVTTQNWVFIDGFTELNAQSIHPAATGQPGGMPGGRVFASSWKDKAGKLWMFGGEFRLPGGTTGALSSELWMYDPTAAGGQGHWIIKSDLTKAVNAPGVYSGPVGSMYPGARKGAAAWTDQAGDLWMYGGRAYGAAGGGNLSDLWKYTTLSTVGEWKVYE